MLFWTVKQNRRTMNKIILTDCDGVLLNWEESFHQWMTQKGYNKVRHATYDLAAAYDLHRENQHDVVREFNASAWMCCLPQFRDSMSGVARLVEAGYRFDVITSLGLDPYAKKLRQQNLDTVFGKTPWNSLTCLDTAADKDAALEPYRNTGMWWIEDKWENAVLGADLGLRSIIITHDHNREQSDPRITRVNNWNEIANIILDAEHDTA